MKQTRLIMGMPISVEIVGHADRKVFNEVFDYFRQIDSRFSTYKKDSEISQINRGLPKNRWSREVKTVLALCDKTKQETGGYFDIEHDGRMDPSGLVKGWAIQNAAKLLRTRGVEDFYVDAGGDIQVSGQNAKRSNWRIGLRNPFNRDQIIKVIEVDGEGVATSGTYIRGQHVYDPHERTQRSSGIVAISVIGPNIYEADRFATAALAMGAKGVEFIESLKDFEGYMINSDGIATMTSGFNKYEVEE